MTDTSPDYFSRFRVVRQVGEGGMGVVYEAVDAKIGRRVAIKRLHPALAVRTDVVRRFFNEARVVNLISHPTIVQVYEADFAADGSAYLVMEFLDGETLAARLQRCGGRLSIEQSIWILWQLASALQAAHAHGVVHRDLKPSNVMLVPDPAMPGAERIKLLDFGIAKLNSPTPDGEHGPMTRTGMMMGTPIYMAPEQCLGGTQVDGKADVYALGVMAFEMMAGRPPFMAAQDLVLLQLHVAERPPSLRDLNTAVPRGLAQLVAAMLNKSPQERPDMAQLMGELRKWMSALPYSGMPTTPSGNPAVGLVPGGRSHATTLRHLSGQLTVGQQRSVLVAIGVLAALALGGALGWVQWLRRGTLAMQGDRHGGHGESALLNNVPAVTAGGPSAAEGWQQGPGPDPRGISQGGPTDLGGAPAASDGIGRGVPAGDEIGTVPHGGPSLRDPDAKGREGPEGDPGKGGSPRKAESKDPEGAPPAKTRARDSEPDDEPETSRGGRKKGGGRGKKGGGHSSGGSGRSSVGGNPGKKNLVPRIAD